MEVRLFVLGLNPNPCLPAPVPTVQRVWQKERPMPSSVISGWSLCQAISP